MSELLTIPGLDKSFLELLEAAGFHDFRDLAEADDEDLARELERANRILKIAASTPSHHVVAGWVCHARDRAGSEPVPVVADEPIDHERNAKVAAMLKTSPLAIPLPVNALKERGLSVADIPSGLLLSEYPGPLDVRTERRIPRVRADSSSPASYLLLTEKNAQSKLDIDVSRLQSMSQMGPARPREHASPEADEEDRVALIRAPKASTNKGRDPNSRRFIRGVLHSQPAGIYAGALLTVLCMALVPLAVAAALLLLLSREMPQHFGWVNGWWLAFPVSLPVVSLGWAVWGFSGTCRVCGQKLFVHRPHRKNIKAHRITGLGYVLPLCIHILLFRWFRCSHCGTPIRLKK